MISQFADHAVAEQIDPAMRAPLLRRALFSALLLTMVAAFVIFALPLRHQRPSGQGLGADFGMLLGAAQVVKDGGNPYDHALLYRTERAMLRHQGLPITPDPGIVRVGNPPLLFWLLQPLTSLPFQPLAVAWMISMYAFSAAGFLAALRYFGWTRRLLPCLLFLITSPVVREVYHANILAVVFAAAAFSLLLLGRYPFLAGSVLALTWLKPQVGLPVVLLLVVFHAPYPRRLAAGFAAASAAFLALTLITTGWRSLELWIGGLVAYSHDLAPQKVVASLAGLYVLWAPGSLRFALSAGSVVLAAGLTAVFWWRSRRPGGPVPIAWAAWLWFAWFLATPYTHVNDEMVLAIPILALLGHDGDEFARSFPAVAVVLLSMNALPARWTPLALLFVVVILAHNAYQMATFRTLGWPIALAALVALSTLPTWVVLPIRKEPIQLMAVAVCAALAASSLRRERPILASRAPVMVVCQDEPGR